MTRDRITCRLIRAATLLSFCSLGLAACNSEQVDGTPPPPQGLILAEKPTDYESREVRFSEQPKHYLGEVRVREAGKATSKKLGTAVGPVYVPLGHELELRMNADPSDLSPLLDLEPNDLQHIIFWSMGGAETLNVDDEDLKSLAHLTGLISLELSNSKVTAAGLTHLTELPNLVHLDLSNTAITDEGLAAIAQIKSLRRLILSRTKVSGPGLQALKGLANLESLVLSGTDVGGPSPLALPNLPALAMLNLTRTSVSNADLKNLPPLPALRVMILASTDITEAGLPVIQRYEDLEMLDLSRCQISQRAIEGLRENVRPSLNIVF